jgi:hypothetical protein
MLLLSISPPAARHVIDAAFDRQAHGIQLVSASDPVVLLSAFLCFFSHFLVACISMKLNHGKLLFSQKFQQKLLVYDKTISGYIQSCYCIPYMILLVPQCSKRIALLHEKLVVSD